MTLPVTPPFNPEYVLNTRPLSSFAVIAEPAALRHLDVQTFLMESSRTGLTAQQAAPYRARQNTPMRFGLTLSPLI